MFMDILLFFNSVTDHALDIILVNIKIMLRFFNQILFIILYRKVSY
jgi:hypothetical protein